MNPTFGELYRSIGTVFRAGERPDLMEKLRASEPQAHAVQALAGGLVLSTIPRIQPELAVELAAGTPVVSALMATAGIPTLSASVELPSQADRQVVQAQLREVDAAWNAATPNSRILISVGLVHHLPEDALQAVLEWLRERDGLALLAFNAPRRAWRSRHQQPFPSTTRSARRRGRACRRNLGPGWKVDPVEFAFATAKRGRATASFCANTVLVGRTV